MRKSKFTEDQKLSILAEHDSGVRGADLSRKHQISPATFYKWKKEHEEDQDEEKRLIKELKAENARLKKIYANLSMDHEILKEGYAMAKKYAAPDANLSASELASKQGRMRDSRRSIRQSCRVLGFRRQTYYARKNSHQPEQADELLAGFSIDYPAFCGFWL